MRVIKSGCFLFFLFIHLPSTFCQRRIIGGQRPNVNATFMVYMLIAEPGRYHYKGWLCGGAIVDRNFFLTSATCLVEPQLLYAIAGYDKYVNAEHMHEDECIMQTRKRVISWSYHNEFNIQNTLNDSHHWASFDIALARVDPPFDFTDPKYLQYCSYLPSMISVGVGDLHSKYPGISALVYGWGHRKFYRTENDNTDYNSERLRYASVRIISKEECIKHFEAPFNDGIIKHCICTDGPGFLDDEGLITNVVNVPLIHCKNESCTKVYHETRTQGFCQNDHGGPLVMWAGSEQFVVGVATAFIMAGDRRCSPPFVFTSANCVNKFIMCMLSRTRRAAHCARESDMVTVDKHLNWTQVTEATITETVKHNQTQAAHLNRSARVVGVV